ncbi:MAG: hypothetical protein J6Y89_07185 [Lachnospiraceae bacterium]|nr:hypothetical protein [Lachnospiraceae bacterium]
MIFFSEIEDIETSMHELHGVAVLIEAMGSKEALEMGNDERQDALYLLADTTNAIREKVVSLLEEMENQEDSEIDEDEADDLPGEAANPAV